MSNIIDNKINEIEEWEFGNLKPKQKKVVLGQFFTPKQLVEIVYEMLQKNQINWDITIDSSCGTGEFYRPGHPFIGTDIDFTLAKQWMDDDDLKLGQPPKRFFVANGLDVNRQTLGIPEQAILLAIGNPPYNDPYSQYQKGQKTTNIQTKAKSLKGRDLGIQFLNSYHEHLRANFVCVLHPLSYITKKTKFQELSRFFQSYRLIDNLIINSQEFSDLKKKNKVGFPIIIALYALNAGGMTWSEMQNVKFNVGQTPYRFCLSDFPTIENWHTKYKDRKTVGVYKHFFTLRDLNHLVINKGWLEKEDSQSIRVKSENEYLFNYLMTLKKWFSHQKSQFWFLGNLSPIVVPPVLAIFKNGEPCGEPKIEEQITSWVLSKITHVKDD